jgi:DNA-binding HxlR family transcriptional regulator|tara:strand:+ start:17009 stop:17335 length:327 start_codon:yes stop_codon:yes gene_type:complete
LNNKPALLAGSTGHSNLKLLQGTLRFSELHKSITGVSEKVLSQTLHALEADDFVLCTAHPVIPPLEEYSLTDTGREVARQVEELMIWNEVNVNPTLSARDEYVLLKSG